MKTSHKNNLSEESLGKRIQVSLGEVPGDLLITDAEIVNVFTGKIETGNVVIVGEWIAGVGNYNWRAHHTISLPNHIIIPGLIDSHMHLESTLLMPGELAKVIVPHGTTALISDSHEVGNVLGIPGIETLLAASENIPLDLFFAASSCVPAVDWDHSGARLSAEKVNELLKQPRILSLGEMMDIPGLLHEKSEVLQKLLAANHSGKPIDGHAPAVTGRVLQALAASGIRSDHESGTIQEAREKARLGMLVQVREGSVARNLDALLPLLNSNELGDFWTLVTDDVLPTELVSHGHIDNLLRKIIQAGVPGEKAVRQATLIPARHYHLWDRGAVAPGYRADLAVISSLEEFLVTHVIKNGTLVAEGGELIESPPSFSHQPENTIHTGPLNKSHFQLHIKSNPVPVMEIIPGQLITKLETKSVQLDGRYWIHNPAEDIALIASIERHKKLNNVGLGLVKGFQFDQPGALISSVAHDSHNLIVVGTNPEDMLKCVQYLAEVAGGFAVVSKGKILADLPLPFAGLLTSENANTVCQKLARLERAAQSIGCKLPCPFGALSFLALPVIPDIKITDQGMFDINKQAFVTY